MRELLTSVLEVLIKEGGLGYVVAILVGIVGGYLYNQKHREVQRLTARMFELSQTVMADVHSRKHTEEYIHELTNLIEKSTTQIATLNAKVEVLLDRKHNHDGT